MQFAVIQTGGKQYVVSPGQKLNIEKLDGDAGREILFDRVLLVSENEKTEIGVPMVKGASVRAKIVRHARAKKVIALRYHSKTRLRKKRGHRQHFTEVQIQTIRLSPA